MTAISNATLSVAITDPNGVVATSSAATDANGAFTVNMSADIIGNYVIDVSFAGDINFAPATAEVTVTVQGVTPPAATAITLTGPTAPVAQGTAVVITGVLNTV